MLMKVYNALSEKGKINTHENSAWRLLIVGIQISVSINFIFDIGHWD